MKKLLKILCIGLIINIFIGVIFLGWLSHSLLLPALAETEITVKDLVFNKLDPQKYTLLEQNISKRSKELGKEVSRKISDLFPSPDFNYSDMPSLEYPYPSTDEILEMNELAAQRGIKKGLNYLKKFEKQS